MRFGESVVNGGNVQPYRHTGMEMQGMHGLNWIDNKARMRTVGLPAFTTPDPLMEAHCDVSPYAYCLDNSINNIDPLGLDTVNANTPKPVKKGDVMVDNKGVIGTASFDDVNIIPQSDNNEGAPIFIYIDPFVKFLNYTSAIGSLSAGNRYVSSNYFRDGYFVTLKGKQYPLSVLNRQSNGKFAKGIQGLRNGANSAKFSVETLTRTIKIVNYIQGGIDLAKFANDQSLGNGANVVIDGVSYMFWEVGVVNAGIQLMIDANSGEREQIKKNIMNNENPMNNVYVPGLGTDYFSPF
jgi:RHS repeat-associated protein